MKDRATWLHEKQAGRCFLMTTDECRAADGALSLKQRGKGGGARGWTWEHVIPVSLCRRLGVTGFKLKLLACGPCNHAKGAALPRDEHVVLGLTLSREWFSLPGTSEVRGQIGAEIIADLDLLVAEYYRRGAKLAERIDAKSKTPPKVLAVDDADVPATIEEALAQGGIVEKHANKQKTAIALGVTHPDYVPGAKQRRDPVNASDVAKRNARFQARALRLAADRAEIKGDTHRARELRAQAWAIIDAAEPMARCG